MNTLRATALLIAFGAFALAPTNAAPVAAKHKDAVQVQAALVGAGSDVRETNLGDLVADAVRQTGAADAALVPANEFSDATLPAGSATAAQIVAMLKFADDPSDAVIVLHLTGAQLLKAVERSVSRAPSPFNGFLQVSGLQVRYDPSAPEGKRIGLVGQGGGEIDAAKTYKVAVTRPIADGGLGYFQIWDKTDVAQNTGQSISQSLATYLTAHPTIAGNIEGRITASH